MISIIIIIVTIMVCAYFWRRGGDGQSLWRNPGVPIVISLAKFGLLCLTGWSVWNLLALAYIPALWGMIQAVSYGSSAPPHKFWVFVIGHINGKYNDPVWKDMAEHGQITSIELCTRCTCGFFWSLPAAIFAFLSGAWVSFIFYVFFLTIVNGYIWLLIPDVEVNERAVGACVSTSILV